MELGLTRVDLLQVGLTYPKSAKLLPNVSPGEKAQQKVNSSYFNLSQCFYLKNFNAIKMHSKKCNNKNTSKIYFKKTNQNSFRYYIYFKLSL